MSETGKITHSRKSGKVPLQVNTSSSQGERSFSQILEGAEGGDSRPSAVGSATRPPGSAIKWNGATLGPLGRLQQIQRLVAFHDQKQPGLFVQEDQSLLHYFYQSGDLKLHVQQSRPERFAGATRTKAPPATSSQSVSRPDLVMACPGGNEGGAIWFEPLTEMEISHFQKIPSSQGGGQAVSFRVTAREASSLTIRKVALESLRGIRLMEQGTWDSHLARRKHLARELSLPLSWVEPEAKIMHAPEGSLLSFTRTTLDHKASSLTIALPAHVRIARTPGGIVLESPKGVPLSMRVTMTLPYPPLSDLEHLLNPETQKFLQTLKQSNPETFAKVSQSLRNLRFLSSKEKFLAGSWRYLTYFGRDTALSLCLLRPLLSDEAYLVGVQSLLDRLSPDGSVAHEEEVGSWPEQELVSQALALIREGKKESARQLLERAEKGVRPRYDYKMIDTPFLLPLVLKEYLLDPSVPNEKKREFLERKGRDGETNLSRILRNLSFVLRATERGERDRLPLIGLPPGQEVGDWRDSRQGLGGGEYPVSVNHTLVQASLKALHGILSSEVFSSRLSQHLRQPSASSQESLSPPSLQQLEKKIHKWEKTSSAFKVRLTPEQLRKRVGEYLEQASLSQEEKEYFLNQPLEGSMTVNDFLSKGKVPEILKEGVTFPALSLDRDRKPIPVMNSDISFSLFFGSPSPDELQKYVTLLSLPFPVGLRTPVGTLVTNPASSTSPHHWKSLDKAAYHGTTIWGWQHLMLELGLLKQIKRFQGEKGNQSLVRDLQRTLALLQEERKNAGDLVHSELWSYSVAGHSLSPSPFGQKGEETVANPIQLWSTVLASVERESWKAKLPPGRLMHRD